MGVDGARIGFQVGTRTGLRLGIADRDGVRVGGWGVFVIIDYQVGDKFGVEQCWDKGEDGDKIGVGAGNGVVIENRLMVRSHGCGGCG